MTHSIQPQPGLLHIKPYVGGEDIIPKGYQCKVLLSSNENPLGASPKAMKVLQDNAARIHIYPSGTSRKLKGKLAEIHGLEENRLLCTNGSEDGLTLLIRAFAGQGDEVVFSQYAFSLYRIVSLSVGATPVAAPAPNLTVAVDSILASVTSKTKLVVIDNPSNPIGGYINREEVLRLRRGLPQNVLLVLDSAYAEYMSSDDYTAGIDLVNEFENVVMTRTFSKFYGLAGLRVGWMYGPECLINYVNRIRAPFCCNSLVQDVAIAALEDEGHQEAVMAHNRQTLSWFMAQLDALGLNYIPSVTNFVTVEFSKHGACSAEGVYLRLAEDGYIVRPIPGYGLPDHLRITMGLQEHMEKVVQILSSFLNDSLPKYGISK